MPPCQNLAFYHQSVMRYCHSYALMTPYKSFFKLAWFLRLRTKIFVEGFLGSHWSITVVISCRQLVPACWFLARIHFSVVLISQMITTSPISSQIKCTFCGVTLYYSKETKMWTKWLFLLLLTTVHPRLSEPRLSKHQNWLVIFIIPNRCSINVASLSVSNQINLK